MNLNKRKQKQRKDGKSGSSNSWRLSLSSVQIPAALLLLGILIIGSLRNPDFWSSADQRGEALFRAGKFAESAKTFTDPWRLGTAQYRNGDFEMAAKTFARVPGAKGAFDQGNAWLMHGQYAAAMASYDRALGFQPGWREAEENKALAAARKAVIDGAGKDRDQSQGDTDRPDGMVFDENGGADKGGDPPESVELAGGEVSDDQLRASWLRRVQTTPGDFLRAKFAYQAAHAEPEEMKASTARGEPSK